MNLSEKKAEMVRRSTLVKWIRRHDESYELLAESGANSDYLKGLSYALNRLCKDFNITRDELQRK
jgi:hypothetical protein